MDCSPPGFSVHVIFQARILEWFAISSSRGPSPSRDWTRVSCVAGRFFTTAPPGKPLLLFRAMQTKHLQAIFFFFPILLSASWTSFIYLQPLSLSTGRYQAWPGNQYEPEKQDISFLFHTSKWGKLLRMLREQLAAHHPFFSACMANTGIIFCQGYGPRLNSKTLFLWWSQSKISFTSWKLL